MQEEVLQQVDRNRIVELACNLANTVSITGEEENVAKYIGSELEELGMQVEYQYVEDGRPNVVGILKGTGGGATLMFNAHMDHFDTPQETVVDEDRIYGRGLVNMKAAFPCYIEAVSALQKAGVKLKGDVIIAGVVGEIEKAQIGRFQGKDLPRRRRRCSVLDGSWRYGRHVHYRRAYRVAVANRQFWFALGSGQRRWQGDEICSRRLQGRAGDSGVGKGISA